MDPASWYDRLRARRELAHPWKFPVYVYHKMAHELWRRNFILNYGGVTDPVGRVLVLEHIRPFYRPPSKYDPRPGRWSKVKNVELFNELGFAVDVFAISDSDSEPDNFERYDILFGAGPRFERFASRMPADATVIYYSGSNHHQQLIDAYRTRLDRFKERHDTDIGPARPGFFSPDARDDTPDAIIAMGDTFTKRTYTDRVDLPVYTVHTTHNPDIGGELPERDYATARQNFLWFAGTGPILKGLDLVLDAFMQLPEFDLYLVGPYDNHEGFMAVYNDYLCDADNIHQIGYVDSRSPLFDRLVRTCAFQIYPSASEGSSGAVATCMWRGVVPVVTETVFDETSDWGVMIPGETVGAVRDTIRSCAQMSPATVEAMSRRTYQEAHRRYDRDAYSERMHMILTDICDRFDIKYQD